MKIRAAHVATTGKYLGFFEWVVSSVIRGASIQMLFGSRVYDVGLVFGPQGAAHSSENTTPTLRVIACKIASGGGLLSAVVPSSLKPVVNHYVIGIPLGVINATPAPAASLLQSASEHETAAAAAHRAGWGIKLTDATGDCAPDTMAYFDGATRNIETWSRVRKEIAEKIMSVADQAEWQQVFKCCCEGEGNELGGLIGTSDMEITDQFSEGAFSISIF